MRKLGYGHIIELGQGSAAAPVVGGASTTEAVDMKAKGIPEMSDRLFRACLRALVTMVGAAGVLLLVSLSGGVSSAAAAAGNDSCGYASSTFTESTVMRWAQVNGTGTNAQIVGFANDEKGL